MPVDLRQLRRLRWAVRAALVVAVAASLAANVLHAQPDPIARTIAAWPPLALLLTIELISRIPMHRRSLAAVRLVATAAIAGIAAYVSYWHMVAVASRYGEVGSTPYLLPVSVDGLVIVASVSLVELAGRIRLGEVPEVAQLVDEPAADPVATALALVAAGARVPEAAEKAGISKATVYRWIKRATPETVSAAAAAPPGRAAPAPYRSTPSLTGSPAQS